MYNTAAPGPADSAKCRVWIKTAILCSTLNPPSCLAAGGIEKHLAHFDTQTKEGTRRAGLARARVWGRRARSGKVTGLVFKSSFNFSYTGLLEALAAGECGYCSLKVVCQLETMRDSFIFRLVYTFTLLHTTTFPCSILVEVSQGVS